MGEVLDPRFALPRTLFFGIGAQKCATSWLDKHLRTQPEICMPVRKEQHYWTTRAPGAADKRLAWIDGRLKKAAGRSLWKSLTRTRRGRDRDEAWTRMRTMLRHDSIGHKAYADVLFQRYEGQPVLGEVTPEYALLPAEGFAEMAALGRDVRFIMIMRDPLDRLRSGARQNLRKRSGAEAVTPDGLAARMSEATSNLNDPAMLRSRYDVTIRALDEAVAREKTFYFFYETMFRQAEMDRLADFLGIARRPAPVDRMVHASKYSSMGFPPEIERAALKTLAPTYEFVRDRFGDLVPGKWQQPALAGAEV